VGKSDMAIALRHVRFMTQVNVRDPVNFAESVTSK